jgi:two-component system response regulator FixJ
LASGDAPVRGTVYIVEDDEAVRDSLRVLLEASDYEVRTHDNAMAFLCEAPAATGCVLTDVSMPDMSGLELQRRLNEQGSQLPVIVMTGQADIPTAVSAMREGAIDFLEKPFSGEVLREAIFHALEVGTRLRDTAAAARRAASRLAMLTRREREVVDCLVRGLSSKAIARELGASPRTIEGHRARVVKKLEIHTLPELVRLVQAAEPRRPAR